MDMDDHQDLCAAVWGLMEGTDANPIPPPSESTQSTPQHTGAKSTSEDSQPASSSWTDYEWIPFEECNRHLCEKAENVHAPAPNVPPAEPNTDTYQPAGLTENSSPSSFSIIVTPDFGHVSFPHSPEQLAPASLPPKPVTKQTCCEDNSPPYEQLPPRSLCIKTTGFEEDSPQYELPPPSSLFILTNAPKVGSHQRIPPLLHPLSSSMSAFNKDNSSNPNVNSNTSTHADGDPQGQRTEVHATLLQTRATFASSPHVLDPDAELKKFEENYEPPMGTEAEAEMHRMHAEISFMWSVIRKGRHKGLKKEEQVPDTSKAPNDVAGDATISDGPGQKIAKVLGGSVGE